MDVTIPYEENGRVPTGYDHDLTALPIEQLNDLLIDVAVEIAGRAKTKPTEILKMAYDTGRRNGF